MDSKLEKRFTSVLGVRSRADLFNECFRFAQDLGFSRVTASVIVDVGPGETRWACVDNMPEAFEPIGGNKEICRIDPVAQHCKASSRPIIWDQSTYVLAGLADKWEQQAPYGYEAGIAQAFHMPRRNHFLFGVHRVGALPTELKESCRLVADLSLFAAQVQEVALAVLLPDINDAAHECMLTRRELECLHWTMEGKTAW